MLLELFNNTLVGTIPEPVGKLASLKLLDLEYNLFSGMIPDSVFTELDELLSLRLSSNALTGSVPAMVSELDKLEELWVAGNLLGGSLPTELGSLVDLCEYICILLPVVNWRIEEVLTHSAFLLVSG